METFTKVDANTIEITAEVKAPEVIVKEFSQLEADLKQAQDSLVYVQQRHAEEILPIQKTIDLMKARVAEATKQGVIAKPISSEPLEE